MAARKQGEVLEREWKSGLGYALRFKAYGERQYVTLGYARDGWDPDRAEEELQNILADVRRGLWVPPQKRTKSSGEESERGEVPLFGPFARDLVEAREGQVAEKTTKRERWALGHLMPYFGDWAVNEIDVEAVDDYRLFKVKESEARAHAIERGRPQRNGHGQLMRPLSAGSINKTIGFLQWALSVALEYKRFGLTENPAAGKRRRLPERAAPPVHLNSPAQIEALLEASAGMDRDPRFGCAEREAILATLILAGPRAHELCNLLWRDVDLANGRLFIGRSKTQAGLREITMLPILRDVLAAHKAGAFRSGPDDLVFPTATGGRRDPDNLRARVLAPTLERADELLERRGLVPLPKGLTTHKLRHTFASVLIACGEDPVSVMRQIGHADPSFTLRVYAHMMNRDPAERERLKALVRGERVIAREAPPPRPVELIDYERPIVAALAERGGRAARREIVAAVGEAMADRHSECDLEALPSGPPRWKPRIGKVRSRLVRRGWLKAGGGRGDWELTERGWAKAQRERARGAGGQPVEPTEPEMAVAA